MGQKNTVNFIRSLLGFVIALAFIAMGVYLIRQESTFAVIAGYAGIVFFGLLALFYIYGIIKKAAGRS